MPSEIDTRRFIAAIYPTRKERALSAVVAHCYDRPTSRVLDWIGDRADDLRCSLLRRRAARGRHLIARPPVRDELRYVTVWNRIINPDGSLCCWHPDTTGCPLLGHELVPLYEVVGAQTTIENNEPLPVSTGGEEHG